MDRVDALIKAKVDAIVIDTAHGHSENVIRIVKMVRDAYSDIQIIAGNVATGEATLELIKAGVDAVKVGIGRFNLYYQSCCGYWCTSGYCNNECL